MFAYDFIGAQSSTPRVLNGGLSLRNVDAHLTVLKAVRNENDPNDPLNETGSVAEDIWWCTKFSNLPTNEIANAFSVEKFATSHRSGPVGMHQAYRFIKAPLLKQWFDLSLSEAVEPSAIIQPEQATSDIEQARALDHNSQ
jgi:hypothetical protein